MTTTADDDQTPSPEPDGAGWTWFGMAGTLSFMAVLVVGLTIVLFGAADWNDDAEAAGDTDAVGTVDGAQIYQAHCATCHGDNGEGDVGPRLAGVVADQYPDIADQIAIVVNGRGAMNAFGGVLSEEQIEAVVIYERTELGEGVDLPAAEEVTGTDGS